MALCPVDRIESEHLAHQSVLVTGPSTIVITDYQAPRGLRCRLHPPMSDSHPEFIGSQARVSRHGSGRSTSADGTVSRGTRVRPVSWCSNHVLAARRAHKHGAAPPQPTTGPPPSINGLPPGSAALPRNQRRDRALARPCTTAPRAPQPCTTRPSGPTSPRSARHCWNGRPAMLTCARSPPAMSTPPPRRCTALAVR
jgi:hypothetical protein